MTKSEENELMDILYYEPVDRAGVKQFIYRVIDRVKKENKNKIENEADKPIEFICQGDCECCAYADEEECGGVMLYGPNQMCAELKSIKRDKIIASIVRFDYGDKGCRICEHYMEKFSAPSPDEINYCAKYKQVFKDGECICKGKDWSPR